MENWRFQLTNIAEELAQLESLDNGKPVAIAGAADVPLSLIFSDIWLGKPLK